MQIETRTLQFDHLLVHETKQLKTDWQSGVFMMEEVPLALDIYKNGPIFFSVRPEENEKNFGHFTYYLPLNEAVTLEDETYFKYQETFQVEKALVLRQADQAVNFQAAHEKIKKYAIEQGIKLEETFYCVLIEVYDDVIIDLYVPIKKRSDDE